ncbi:hypothetical protein Pan216_04780 [Planctomycetes bacterium Pan216]|uniref:Peptidase C39 domain-containing protein n=2 Tax=Kolteria novifilia TaxID=2527975 RepID=A0A518AY36_9BACT|nr:hypothetical protein Pan216_04780 [Planctomycetes bacterium Pan216]
MGSEEPARVMRHVPQRTKVDCGVAVLAMLADVSYKRAERTLREVSFMPPGLIGDGVTEQNLLLSLVQLTSQWWQLGFGGGTSLAEWERPEDRAAIVVSPNGRTNLHWVAYEKGEIYDPHSDGSCSLVDYERAHWKVKTTLRRDQSKLGEFQLRQMEAFRIF